MFEAETVWEFSMADRVKFGTGAIDELADELRDRGGESALIVTDEGVTEAGIADRVVDSLPSDVDHTVFTGVEPDPSVDVYESAVAFARDFDPDVVVGVGGGSSIDVAKTTSVVAEYGGDILDYVAPPTGDGKPVPGGGIPVVGVPTTSGTGSETSPVSVISLPDRRLKVGISSRHLYPDLALIDPALTVSLPPGPTAASGMDALSHAIESYTTRRYDAKERAGSSADRPDYDGRNVLTEQLARKAIDLVGDSLRGAVNNGSDLAARRDMSLASLLAGASFTNAGVGATHAIAYPVAGEYHTPHGVTIATLLPEVMRFNATSAFEQYADIAELLGENVEGLPQDEAAERAADAVGKLAADVGIPDGLSALGVTEADVPDLAADTMEIQRLLAGNPRRIDQEDIEGILRRSL
jgi:alcohol dehydrogenase class IV